MRTKFALITLLVAAAATPASSSPPRAMTLAVFLSKAEPLVAHPVLAMMSSDVSLLKTELDNAERQIRARNAALMAQHKTPPSCPPDPARMSIQDLIAHFKSFGPNDQSRLTVTDGLGSFMAKKFPCR